MLEVAPGTQLGRYVLEQELAAGGHGHVFRAHHSGPGGFSKTVAIKIVSAAAAGRPAGLESFLREGRTAALLNHRNIVTVHEVGEERGLYYLVMEHVEGVDLLQLGNAVGRQLPLWVKLGIALELFRALAHAHGLRHERAPNGIVHRDVKPANILLSVDGDVKLTDFGLAKALQVAADEITMSGAVKGTPGYMSPEQHTGQEANAAADIFSAGTVLYRLCTGATPPRLTELPVSPAALQPSGLPAPLCELVALAMHPLPEQRPDAPAMIDGLVRALEQIAPPRGIAQLGAELATWVRRARAAGAPPVVAGAWGDTIGVTEPPGSAGFVPDLLEHEPTDARRRARRRLLRLGVVVGAVLLLAAAGFLGAVRWRRDGDAAGVAPLGPFVWSPDARIQAAPAFPDAGAADEGLAAADAPTASPGGDARPVDDLADPATRVVDAPRTRRSPSRPRPVRPRPPPAPAGVGALSVDSTPWSWVHVDGRRVGMTPVWRLSLAAGVHTVRLVGAGGAAVTRRVTVGADAHVNLGMVDLRGAR